MNEKQNKNNKEKILINELVLQQNELLGSKNNKEKILKFIATLFYALFFALIPSIFIFSNLSLSNSSINTIESFSVFISFAIGIFSIYSLFWIFTDEFREKFSIKYYTFHVINSLFLSLMILIPTFWLGYDGGIDNQLSLAETRLLIYAIASIVWFLFYFLFLFLFVIRYKKQFSSNNLKGIYSIIIGFLFVIEMFMPFLFLIINSKVGSSNITNINQELLSIFIIIIAIMALVIIIITITSYIYVKTFKEPLLANRTSKELITIENNRMILVVAWLSVMASLFLISIAYLTSSKTSIELMKSFDPTSIYFILVVSLDAAILIFYGVLLIYQNRSKEKNTKINSLDMNLIFKVLSWINIVKSLIVMAFIHNNNNVSQTITILIVASTSLSLIFMNLLSILFSRKSPNIKNIFTLVVYSTTAIFLLVFSITFGQWFDTNSQVKNLPIYLNLSFVIVLVGKTIDLIHSFIWFYKLNKNLFVVSEKQKIDEIKKAKQIKVEEERKKEKLEELGEEMMMDSTEFVANTIKV